MAAAADSDPTAGNNIFIDNTDVGGAMLGSVTAAVQAYHQDVNTGIAYAAKLSFVKIAKIETNGLYPAEFIAAEHVYANLPGGGGNATVPNQIALCVSLLTAVTRGPAHRGRFYLPMPTAAPDTTTGLIASNVAGNCVISTRTFLEALSDWPGIDTTFSPNVVVMSRKSGAPKTREVTGVAVGRVLDTQRRRRRSLQENYSTDVVDFGAA
jgi:hypothetical protein